MQNRRKDHVLAGVPRNTRNGNGGTSGQTKDSLSAFFRQEKHIKDSNALITPLHFV